MDITFPGKILIIVFIVLLFKMINDGPFIYATGTKHVVEMLNFKFDKNYLKIKKGDTVVFVNKDQIRHNVVNDNDLIINSPLLYQYDKYEHTFNHDFDKVVFSSTLYEHIESVTIENEKPFVKKSFIQQIINNFKRLF